MKTHRLLFFFILKNQIYPERQIYVSVDEEGSDKQMLILSNTVTSYQCSCILYLISYLIYIFDPTPMYYNYHFIAIRVFSDPLRISFALLFRGSSAASPLKICGIMGPLRTLFKHKTKIWRLWLFSVKRLKMVSNGNFRVTFLYLALCSHILKILSSLNL